jgi:hypothetical protein
MSPNLHRRCRRMTAYDFDATRLGGHGDFNRIFECPRRAAAIDGGQAQKYRLVPGPHRAHGLGDLHARTHAAFEITAVGVFAPVDQRRQKLMDQIAMRGVNFDDIVAGVDGT